MYCGGRSHNTASACAGPRCTRNDTTRSRGWAQARSPQSTARMDARPCDMPKAIIQAHAPLTNAARPMDPDPKPIDHNSKPSSARPLTSVDDPEQRDAAHSGQQDGERQLRSASAADAATVGSGAELTPSCRAGSVPA